MVKDKLKKSVISELQLQLINYFTYEIFSRNLRCESHPNLLGFLLI